MRYANAEAKVVPPTTPLLCHRSDCLTHFARHEHGLKRRVLDRHRIVEDHHHAVTGIALERAAVSDDEFADSGVVVAQQGHHVFRVGALSEPCKPAQIAEEGGYLSAMAFKLLLAPRSDDQISYLRRTEAPQPAHAFDFAYVVGDALFELFVEVYHLVLFSTAAAPANSRVFSDGYGGLVGEAVSARAILLVVKGLHLEAVHHDDAQKIVALAGSERLDCAERLTFSSASKSDQRIGNVNCLMEGGEPKPGDYQGEPDVPSPNLPALEKSNLLKNLR